MFLIKTTEGGIGMSPPGSKDPEWEDEAQARARCEKANAEAEKLGIKTRYEVVSA